MHQPLIPPIYSPPPNRSCVKTDSRWTCHRPSRSSSPTSTRTHRRACRKRRTRSARICCGRRSTTTPRAISISSRSRSAAGRRDRGCSSPSPTSTRLCRRTRPSISFAADQTTTVYTGVRNFPMLPEQLSTGATSLLEDADRLAVVIEFVVAADGDVQSSAGLSRAGAQPARSSPTTPSARGSMDRPPRRRRLRRRRTCRRS